LTWCAGFNPSIGSPGPFHNHGFSFIDNLVGGASTDSNVCVLGLPKGLWE
jgi:hypothetical protein